MKKRTLPMPWVILCLGFALMLGKIRAKLRVSR